MGSLWLRLETWYLRVAAAVLRRRIRALDHRLEAAGEHELLEQMSQRRKREQARIDAQHADPR
jgi:hypothetical protein